MTAMKNRRSPDTAMPLRVLCVHIARSSANEYQVIESYVRNISGDTITHIVKQPELARRRTEGLSDDGSSTYLDFGRDYSISPQPPRLERVRMMSSATVRGIAKLSRCLRHFRPDVLHCVQQKVDVHITALMAKRFRLPYIVYVTYPFQPSLGRTTLPLLRRATAILTGSDFVRETAIRYGIAPEKVMTCYNTTDLSMYDGAVPAGLRRELNLPPKAKLIVCAGRLDPSKGHLQLLEAFAMLAEKEPQAYVLVCGKTFTRDSYDTVIQQRIQELGLVSRVLMLGFRSDMPAVYADSDIFCLPTIDETFGLVFIEAQTARLPCVAVLSGGVPEVVENGVTGFLSAPEDTAALSHNLQTLLANRTQRIEMGTKGRARALSLFAPEVMGPQWSAHLHRILQR